MFRSLITRFALQLADGIDELLIGDFDLIEDLTGIYADIDYGCERSHPLELCAARERRPCNAPTLRPLTVAGQHCSA